MVYETFSCCLVKHFRKVDEMYYTWKISLFATVIVTYLATVSADGEDTIIVNALGRTFTLGMLYDRRSDKIIPGK